MFKESIKSAFKSLVPFWSNELVKYLTLGNEYTMAITMILSESINFLSNFFDDNVTFILIFLFSLNIFLKIYGIRLINTDLIKTPNSITVIGTEKYNSREGNLSSSPAFKAVNMMLIKKYGIKKLRYLKDSNFDIVVDDIFNYELEYDLYVSVKRDMKDKENQKIYITLTSYNLDIDKIISNALDTYNDDDKLYKLKLVGSESNGTDYSYPEAMKYLTYVLVNNYKMSKLKILSENKSIQQNNHTGSNNSENDIKNVNKKKEETCVENIEDLGKHFKNIFLLESCKNYKLEDDIFITIERSENIVSYTLLSNTMDLKDFLKKCVDSYKTSISVKDYKYVLKLSGSEKITAHRNSVMYPKNLIALCDKLILEGHINNFRMLELDGKSVKIIDEISNIVVDNILINTVRTIQSPNSWEKYINTTYILESNDVDVSNYLEKCCKEYDLRLSKNHNGTIYYFKYLGKFGKEKRFSKTVLSSEFNELHETFDNIYNEHSDRLKKDIDQLKNIQYYKNTGLRRKKAYLFHGEPGCGKNASVVGMALYDKRHIIDIPFSILQYNSEFFELMNLTMIDGISFDKNQVIYMFDEMHSGLMKITSGELKNQNNCKDVESSNKLLTSVLNGEQNNNNEEHKMNHDTLDLGCILSNLDGIGNYGGVIYVGLTNYIDKIPDPLKRSLRLTPVYFTYLRKCDVISLLEKFFNIKLESDLIDKIPDRKITPAKLRLLCEQYDNLNIVEFIELINNEIRI